MNLESARVMRVDDQLALAVCSSEQGRDLWRWRMNSTQFVSGSRSKSGVDEFEPSSLKDIHEFCNQLWRNQAYRQGETVVVCAGTTSREITETALLVGSFMIICNDVDPGDVDTAFHPISSRFIPYSDQLTLANCWDALHHASAHCGWLSPETKHFLSPHPRNPVALDMREYLHYDSPLNGSFHAIVPDQLLVFDCPADLPDGRAWADAGGERRFSAAYYADVFGDFGVRVVVRCGGAGP